MLTRSAGEKLGFGLSWAAIWLVNQVRLLVLLCTVELTSGDDVKVSLFVASREQLVQEMKGEYRWANVPWQPVLGGPKLKNERTATDFPERIASGRWNPNQLVVVTRLAHQGRLCASWLPNSRPTMPSTARWIIKTFAILIN